MLFRIFFAILGFCLVLCYKPREDKTKCPKVKALRTVDLQELMGVWYIVQYYASSEELPAYSCMKAEFTVSPETLGLSMNFNYTFIDDPDKETLSGNITWEIPDANQPAHWVHAEDTYEGIYNTYILDTDYNVFGLLLHCAEKSGSTRYLSSLILSRNQTLKTNVISYLREKLPRYDIDLEYMFPMDQMDCQQAQTLNKSGKKFVKNHPLKHKHKHD